MTIDRIVRWLRSGESQIRDGLAPFRRSWRRSVFRLGTLTVGLAGIAGAISLTATLSNQIDAEFASQRPSSVVVTSRDGDTSSSALQEGLATTIDGVEGEGLAYEWDEPFLVTNSFASSTFERHQFEVWGVSESYLRASGLSESAITAVWSGRVALVGAQAADELGVSSIGTTSIAIGGVPFEVIGVARDTRIRSEMLFGIIVPIDSGVGSFGPPTSSSLIVVTDTGASSFVATHLPKALKPHDPEGIQVFVAASSDSLRESVSARTRIGSIAIGALVAILGAAGIATSTSADVQRRIPELGLRRALGATPREILRLIISETALAGLVAGLAGAWIGLAMTTAVSIAISWVPVVDSRLWIGLPILGAAIGGISGVFPALRASRISPRAALVD